MSDCPQCPSLLSFFLQLKGNQIRTVSVGEQCPPVLVLLLLVLLYQWKCHLAKEGSFLLRTSKLATPAFRLQSTKGDF